MAKRDFYEVLGVERSAAEADVKKAYRRMALELHPDRNPGDADAEEKFKEASEAYQVLSDAQKRAAYDQYGHAGLGAQGPGFGSVQDIFSQFGDVFADFFGGGSPFGRRGRRGGPERGADLRTVVRMTLREAVSGIKREVSLTHPGPCAKCDGSGAEGGKRNVCTRCQGTGQITQQRGPFLMQSSCPNCQGAGSTVQTPCAECHGAGQIEVSRTVKVTFPAGIDEGQTLRVPGQGLAGTGGGPAGHLYVQVSVEQHPVFEREGTELIRRLDISFPDAALGTELELETVEETKVKVKVPAGIQPGDTVRVKGAGAPQVGQPEDRGDMICVVQVKVPTKLSSKAKKLLRELEAALAE